MEFLNPAGLYAFAFLPFLFLLYLLRRKPRKIVFSNLLYLREVSAQTPHGSWVRFNLPIIFFIQLLLLALLALALGEPMYNSSTARNVAFILDNSASMQVLEKGKSRFQIAREKAREQINEFARATVIDLFITVPSMGRVGSKLTPSETLTHIERLKPYDLGDAIGSIDKTLKRLIKDNDYDKIYFLTDHLVQGQGGAIQVIPVGQKKENFSIHSFNLSRISFGSSKIRAQIGVTNFSSKQNEVEVVLKGGDGKILFSRRLNMTPWQTLETSFSDVPLQLYYEAEIQASDDFLLDNRRFAVPPSEQEMSILGVSPKPKVLDSLQSIAGLKLKIISPDDYEQYQGQDYSLVIFHYSSPSILPQNQVLLILPPKQNPLVSLGAPLARPVISGWRDPHPLTRYVNFALFRPKYARSLKMIPLGESILQTPEGELAIATSIRGSRTLVLGFDPLPYLGQGNLPISIFTLNYLRWFYETLNTANSSTGEAINIQEFPFPVTMVSPKGTAFPLKKGPVNFSRTFYQGLYRVGEEKDSNLWAVNFENAKESNLTNPYPINLYEETQRSEKHFFLFSLWRYLILSALLLCCFEWYLNPPFDPARNLADRSSKRENL